MSESRQGKRVRGDLGPSGFQEGGRLLQYRRRPSLPCRGLLAVELRAVILLQDSPDAALDLYAAGFFGKGVLSRSGPVSVTGESLQLSLEESFFLASASTGVGVLSVLPELEAEPMDERQCWKTFMMADADFLRRFGAYWRLRNRSWVPRCGLKFGAEFLVYRKGPAFAHAEFAVLVQAVAGKCAEIEEVLVLESWREMVALVRLNAHAKKKVLVLVVFGIAENGITELEPVEFCKQLEFKAFEFERWEPKKSRE